MLQQGINWLTYTALGLSPESLWAQSLHYFVYDSLKILLLLFLMITAVGVVRSYISQQRIKAALSKQRFGLGNLTASGFGALTPFCSCSSIPIFLGFIRAGVPVGISLSFLITSPLVNEYLVVLMLGLFGWKITLAYVTVGVLIGALGGLILGKLNLEQHLEKDFANASEQERTFSSFKARISFGLREAFDITKKLWLWVLIGVGIGALIHNFVPQTLIENMVGRAGLFAVPLAVLLGVPLYGSCAAIVPIALALFQKGMPLGTALAFMMAIAALSFPEAVILRKAMKLKLIAIFFLVVTVGIILVGYVFNALQPMLS